MEVQEFGKENSRKIVLIPGNMMSWRQFENVIPLLEKAVVGNFKKRFMLPFFLVMLAALVLIIGVWNRVSDFKTAYLLSLLFLEVMNWYDGIIIDRLWVGNSKFWLLPGCEDIPYVQTWGQVLKKRSILTLIWVVGAAIVAGIVVFLF